MQITFKKQAFSLTQKTFSRWTEVCQYVEIQKLKRLNRKYKLAFYILQDKELIEEMLTLSEEELGKFIKPPIDLSRQRAGAKTPFLLR